MKNTLLMRKTEAGSGLDISPDTRSCHQSNIGFSTGRNRDAYLNFRLQFTD
jgi:hypothetical protein